MVVRYNEKDEKLTRKINLFEVVLLLVGLSVMLVGGYAIQKQYFLDGYLSWNLLQSIFLWLVLLVLLIIAAIMENVKEELSVIIREHIVETQLLREEATTLKEVVKRKR